MISSRWPRPIGIIESMALMPVCIGSCTDLRAMMPGALTSILRDSVALIGPLPSIGTPSALTTRPISASPTGTCAILPVRLTVSPSRTSSKLPSSATPTLSSSRFSTRPDDAAVAEVEQLAGHRGVEAVDAGDAVAGLEHGAGLA